jgi:hypothetical protein
VQLSEGLPDCRIIVGLLRMRGGPDEAMLLSFPSSIGLFRVLLSRIVVAFAASVAVGSSCTATAVADQDLSVCSYDALAQAVAQGGEVRWARSRFSPWT